MWTTKQQCLHAPLSKLEAQYTLSVYGSNTYAYWSYSSHYSGKNFLQCNVNQTIMVSSYQAMVKKREVEGVLMSLLDLGYADAGMPSLIIRPPLRNTYNRNPILQNYQICVAQCVCKNNHHYHDAIRYCRT